MDKDKKVVITGIGPIASVGIGKEAFWQGILDRKTGIELVETSMSKEPLEKFYLHKVKNFDIKNYAIDQDDLAYIREWKEGEDNIDLFFLLAAVKLALDDTMIDYKTKENNLALVVTHENPGIEQLLWKIFRSSYQLLKDKPNIGEKEFFEKLFNKTVKVGYETQAFMFLFHIARTFNIHKHSLFVNNACASGLYAIEAASDMIKGNRVPMVVVAAGDYPDIFKHLWFKKIDMYEPNGKIKPFSRDAKGFIMGEGATALVLEDCEHAKERGAHIYAEYLGGGFSLEGWGITTPMIGGNSYQNTIKSALNKSRINKEKIDLICAHGTGTPASDYYEAKAIMDVFGNSKVPVTAFKPYVGHNLGGSTLVELAILLLALENQVIPPVMNTMDTDPRVNIDLVRDERKVKLSTVLKLCCAFAGNNAATVFRGI